jgi:hypothetical protein
VSPAPETTITLASGRAARTAVICSTPAFPFRSALRESVPDLETPDASLENVREATEILEHMADLDDVCTPQDECRVDLDAIKRESERRADLEALAALRRSLADSGAA